MLDRIANKVGRVVGFIPAMIVVFYLLHKVAKRVRMYTNDIEVVRYISHRVIDIAIVKEKNILWHPCKFKNLIDQVTDAECNKWLY